ncbi:MAG TPA: hypothetical protein EYN79_03165 [Planctomycetes bacterium]|nr:hypothetical protein [Planctomycetota bacterium]HIN80038.1 hypothetical protein [Planctomycetota bacterium]
MYEAELHDLPEGCQSAIVEFLAGSSVEDHSSCTTCSGLLEQLREDQQLLVGHFRRELAEPRKIDFRSPMLSASGHPRRISLAVIPILLLLMLVTLVGIDLLTAGILKKQRAGRFPLIAGNEILRLEEALWKSGASDVEIATLDWEILVSMESSLPNNRLIRRGTPPKWVFLDPFGQPYLLMEVEGSLQFYSAGENGVDDKGTGDDVVSPRLLAEHAVGR